MSTPFQIITISIKIAALDQAQVLGKSIEVGKISDAEPDSVAIHFLCPVVPRIHYALSSGELLLGISVVSKRPWKKKVSDLPLKILHQIVHFALVTSL